MSLLEWFLQSNDLDGWDDLDDVTKEKIYENDMRLAKNTTQQNIRQSCLHSPDISKKTINLYKLQYETIHYQKSHRMSGLAPEYNLVLNTIIIERTRNLNISKIRIQNWAFINGTELNYQTKDVNKMILSRGIHNVALEESIGIFTLGDLNMSWEKIFTRVNRNVMSVLILPS